MAYLGERGSMSAAPERFINEDAPHGTHDGYVNWGCRCRACSDGNSRYQREWRQRNAEAARENSRKVAARHRAKTRLAHAHPEEFQMLYREELGL